VGLEKGRLSAGMAVERGEVVKGSRFVAGKMAWKTHEKTRAFWQNMVKKYKCAHHSALGAHQMTLF
jgi:hypothetical protein